MRATLMVEGDAKGGYIIEIHDGGNDRVITGQHTNDKDAVSAAIEAWQTYVISAADGPAVEEGSTIDPKSAKALKADAKAQAKADAADAAAAEKETAPAEPDADTSTSSKK